MDTQHQALVGEGIKLKYKDSAKYGTNLKYTVVPNMV